MWTALSSFDELLLLFRVKERVGAVLRVAATGLTWSGLSAILNFVVLRNISEAKAELSALVERVQKGDEVILAKAGKPVAKLVAYRGPASPRMPGSMSGEIWIGPDFDGLPDDIAEAFGATEPKG